MEQVIYADILFLIDVSMDFLALYITAFIFKLRFKSGNCILAAAIGAVFSVISVVLRSESLLASVAVSVIMCVVAYFGNGIKVIFKSILAFYAVNMLLGGAMTAIFNAFNALTDGTKDLLIYGEVNEIQSNMPFAIFLLSFGAILILTKILIRLFNGRPAKSLKKVKIIFESESAEFYLSEDSGNRLCEPLSGEPIVFIKERSLKMLGNERLMSALKMQNEFYGGKDKHKYRVVFYQTVSGSDMCVCFKPDKILIDGKEASAWVAIGKNINTDGIDGIVPSSLLG